MGLYKGHIKGAYQQFATIMIGPLAIFLHRAIYVTRNVDKPILKTCFVNTNTPVFRWVSFELSVNH